jgi:O-antigen/teichoic acid export membrane protein
VSRLRAPLVRSTFGLALSRAVAGLLVVLASVVVARAAGAESLGAFGLALTVGVYASVVADAGISQYLLPELGRAPRERWPTLWAEVVRFELRTALPVLVAYAFLVGVVVPDGARLALLAAGPWWLLLRFNGAARSVFTVAERVGAEAVATVAEATVALVVIALVLAGSNSPTLAVLALAAGAALGLAIRLVGLRRLGVAGGRAERRPLELAREALPFGAFTILTTLYLRIDVVLLALLATQRELGLYQPAVRFATALIILPDALASILLGRAARSPEGADVRRRQEQVLSIGVPVGLAVVAICAVAGKPALSALYGAEFGDAWLALTLLAATVPVALVAAVNGNALTARGRQGDRLRCLLLASVVAIAAGVPAIAVWGVNGAAAVSLVNEVVLAAGYALVLGRRSLVLPRLRLA